MTTSNIHVVRDRIIKHYYGVEGGKVNNKDDLGGLTGAGGITKTKLDEHEDKWAKYGWSGDMDNIPYGLYHEIMVEDFWDKMWGDKLVTISHKLIDTMYGWAINSSPYYPVKAMQEHLNVMNLKQTRYADTKIDGGMGKHTWDTLGYYLMSCARRRPMDKLIGTLYASQYMHYIDISLGREANETFTDGWLNRIMEKMERLAK